MEPNHSLSPEATPAGPPSEKGRLFITGASGSLGWFLCRIGRRAGWEIIGGYHRAPIEMPGVSWRKTDLARASALPELLSEIRPRAVIHAGAIAGINACERRPEESWEANVAASGRIAHWCAEHRVPLVFTSSDMVFGGDRPPYRETDPVAPVCQYGKQKAAAEDLVLERCPAAVICRLPLMFGMGGGNRLTFDARVIADLRRNRQVPLFTDEFRTPVDLESAAEGVLAMVGQAVGRLHMGGRRRVSRHEMGRLVARLLGLDASLLILVRQREAPMGALRPADLSLDSRKAVRLGYRPRPLAEGYRRMLSFRAPSRGQASP
jgi:dTDP-4-dehydrorhamnose reductase